MQTLRATKKGQLITWEGPVAPGGKAQGLFLLETQVLSLSQPQALNAILAFDQKVQLFSTHTAIHRSLKISFFIQ